MKKILTAALLLTSMSISAQETYQNAEVATEELNGTARYVGMGGAMEALGADLSAAGQNPAALGLFRRGQVSASFGLTQQPNGGNNGGDSKANMNVDQLGVVFTSRTGRNSMVNFGFGYRKSANYNQMLDIAGKPLPYSADGKTYGSSQNTLTYEKFDMKLDDLAFSQPDYLYSETMMMVKDDEGNVVYDCYSSDAYVLSRERKGYTGSFDFMLGGNYNDRFYYGLSATIASVNYKNNTYYGETVIDDSECIGTVEMSDERKITGTGFNIKGGVILRPIEGSPFRLGLSFETPTWYSLTTKNSTEIYNGTDRGAAQGKYMANGEAYDYEISTPWKFGISAGTTVGKSLAIGATFNYADYSSMKTRIIDGDHYDWWTDSYYTSSHKDDVMNNHTDNALKGVSTFKVGAEYRIVPEVAFRLGYNYVAPMYKETATRNYTLLSPGTYYSSTTDFTNWKATNRFTVGLGYTFDNFTVDLAYQYSTTEGDFSPYYMKCSSYTIAAEPVKIKNDRNQLLCSLTYKF